MQVSALTDDELRSLIDVEPDNLDAVREGARRFVEGSTCEAIRIEELETELAEKEAELMALESKIAKARNALEEIGA